VTETRRVPVRGFRLAHGGGGHGAALGLVQKLVRALMYQRGELLGLRLAGQQSNSSAVADAKRRGNLFVVFEFDVLLVEKRNQAFALVAHFARNAVLELRQVCAFGLRAIEDVDGAEANQHRGGLCFLIGARVLLVIPAPMANDGGKNLNALLALPHKPAQLVPSADTGNAGSGWALPCDGENIAKAVVVKTGHCAEIRGQGFALALLKLLEQEVNGLLDELLRGVFALGSALLIGGVAAVRRILPVRRGG